MLSPEACWGVEEPIAVSRLPSSLWRSVETSCILPALFTGKTVCDPHACSWGTEVPRLSHKVFTACPPKYNWWRSQRHQLRSECQSACEGGVWRLEKLFCSTVHQQGWGGNGKGGTKRRWKWKRNSERSSKWILNGRQKEVWVEKEKA